MNARALTLATIVAATSLMAGGCGGPAGPTSTTSPTASGAPLSIDVTLGEWAIGMSAPTVKAGEVTFNVTNQGPSDVHEFVVIKTDLSLLALPTDATGTVEEEAAGLQPIGEVEDVAVGASEPLKLTLTPGSYVVICNIYNAEENEAHYQKGMRASLTVTP